MVVGDTGRRWRFSPLTSVLIVEAPALVPSL